MHQSYRKIYRDFGDILPGWNVGFYVNEKKGNDGDGNDDNGIDGNGNNKIVIVIIMIAVTRVMVMTA